VVESGHFGAPDSGGVEKFEHRPVAQAEGIVGVGDGKDAADFLLAEVLRQFPGLFARQVEIGGRVGGDDAGPAEPGEES
jgi:hypothetical protein